MGMYANLDAKTLRDLYRREKGSWEYESMNRRYDKECGECLSFPNKQAYENYLKCRKQNT